MLRIKKKNWKTQEFTVIFVQKYFYNLKNKPFQKIQEKLTVFMDQFYDFFLFLMRISYDMQIQIRQKLDSPVVRKGYIPMRCIFLCLALARPLVSLCLAAIHLDS